MENGGDLTTEGFDLERTTDQEESLEKARLWALHWALHVSDESGDEVKEKTNNGSKLKRRDRKEYSRLIARYPNAIQEFKMEELYRARKADSYRVAAETWGCSIGEARRWLRQGERVEG